MNRLSAVTLFLFFVLWGRGEVRAADPLSVGGCDDRSNLKLRRSCNPYGRLLRLPRSEQEAEKNESVPSPENLERTMHPALSGLVESYIRYKDALLERRAIPPNRIVGAAVAKNYGVMLKEVREASRNGLSSWDARRLGKEVEKLRRSLKGFCLPVPQRGHGPIAEKPFRLQEGNFSRRFGNRTVQWLPATLNFPAGFAHLIASPKGVCQECRPLGGTRLGANRSLLVPGYPITKQWFESGRHPYGNYPLWHRVVAGESFIRLARRYDTTVYDIKRLNRLKPDHLLKVGENLLIHPGEKSPPETIRLATARAKAGRYTVRSGDTLIGISKRFKVNLQKLRWLNNLPRGKPLRKGEKLWIPLPQKKIDRILAQESRNFKYVGKGRFKHKLRVVATAYTSHRSQTDRTPFLAAWNNRIRPGMKIIAVSNDLIRKYGITNGTRVRISGLPGIYTVRDKMHPRMRRHIDIYMGTNRRRALRWGRRRVTLYW
ncbi:LysM peptidoglycan-binding domain-containing protein [Nitratifractor sp.]